MSQETELTDLTRKLLACLGFVFDKLDVDPAETYVNLRIMPGRRKIGSINLGDTIERIEALLPPLLIEEEPS